MRLFDGKKVADKILEDLKEKIRAENLKPKLAVFLIGENEASKIYIRLKKEAAKKIGVEFELFQYGVDISEEEVINKIKELNEDDLINGIIVQLPLPKGFDKDKILSVIDPCKDIDGFHIENRRLFEGEKPRFIPPLPAAILLAIREAYNTTTSVSVSVIPAKAGIQKSILSAHKRILDPRLRGDDKLKGSKTVALVNSDIFGQALKIVLEKTGMDFKYLLQKACSLSGGNEDLKSADIVITACGCPNLIRGEIIKQGAVVIDGGIYRYQDGRIIGDVERESVENVASFLTPVQGGLGPLVIALLLKNVVRVTEIDKKKDVV